MSNFTSHVPLPFYNVLLISICFIYVLVTFFSTPTCFVKMLRTCQTFTLPVYFLNNHLWCYSDTHLSCFTSPACFLNSCDVMSKLTYCIFWMPSSSTPTCGVAMLRTCCIFILFVYFFNTHQWCDNETHLLYLHFCLYNISSHTYCKKFDMTAELCLFSRTNFVFYLY